MRTRRLVFGLLALAAAAACRSQPRAPRVVGPPPPPFQKITVAVLPFDNATADIDVPIMLRNQFANRIGSRAYYVKNVAETDDQLRGMGITLGGQIKGVAPKDFSKLGVDAVLSGTVFDATSIITGIYNRRTLDAELVLTDVRTGNVIWKYRDRVTGEDSASAKNGMSLLASAVHGVERANLQREAATLANIAVNRMPVPPREGELNWNGQPVPAPIPMAPVTPPAPH